MKLSNGGMNMQKQTDSNEVPKIYKESSTRKYFCPNCGMSVRATKDVLLKCGYCDVFMKKSIKYKDNLPKA